MVDVTRIRRFNYGKFIKDFGFLQFFWAVVNFSAATFEKQQYHGEVSATYLLVGTIFSILLKKYMGTYIILYLVGFILYTKCFMEYMWVFWTWLTTMTTSLILICRYVCCEKSFKPVVERPTNTAAVPLNSAATREQSSATIVPQNPPTTVPQNFTSTADYPTTGLDHFHEFATPSAPPMPSEDAVPSYGEVIGSAQTLPVDDDDLLPPPSYAEATNL